MITKPHFETGNVSVSCDPSFSPSRLTRALISDCEKFQKPQATGRLSDYVITNQLNGALEHIDQVLQEALRLPDDIFSAFHRQLTESRNIIDYVIRCMEYDEDSEEESSL